MPASDSEREKLCAFSFGVPWGLTFFQSQIFALWLVR